MAIPVHSNIVPAAGTALAFLDFAQFEVTSAPALAGVVVSVRYPGLGTTEVVWDGTAFTAAYAASTRTAIAGGFRFRVRREPSWPDAPTLTLLAINTGGEVLSDETVYALQVAPASVFVGSSVANPVPLYPSGPGPGTGADAAVFTYDALLALADRVLSEEYLRPMRDGAGPGYELVRAYARLFARVSEAVQHAEIDALAAFATGGAFAEGVVEFYRNASSAGAVTVKRGSVVSDGRVPFVVLEDAVFGAMDLGPKAVRVRSLVWGYAGNVPGEVIRPTGEVLEGAIDTIERLLEEPPLADTGIRVRNPAPIIGGRDRALDALGSERNLARRINEADISYRYRVRSLPDNITAPAIRRQVAAALDRWHGGTSFELVECWRPPFGLTWSGPRVGGGSYVAPSFTWSDPRPRSPFRHRWGSAELCPGGFVVVVPNLPTAEHHGFAWSDPSASTLARTVPETGGRRAKLYWSVPDSTSAIASGQELRAYWSGIDNDKAAAYAAVDQLLQEIKAAGITAVVQIRET